MLGALKQGALVDVFKRFPTAGKVLSLVFRSYIKRLTKDTLTNEDMAIELVQRSLSVPLHCLQTRPRVVLTLK